MMLIAVLLFIIVFIAANKLVCFHSRSKVCLVGKTALITGGASGIGFQTALALASKGCRVIIADIIGISEAVQEVIKQSHNPNIIGKRVDLQSFKSVRALASNIIETESRLDILINNAGTADVALKDTEDGLQKTMQVNYFSHFLLTHLLLDIIKKSSPSRIIFTSSILAYITDLKIDNLNPKNSYNILASLRGAAYGYSKLCLAAAAKLFGEKLKGTGVTANVFHPGGSRTYIFFKTFREDFRIITFIVGLFTWSYGKSPEEGAQTLIHLAQADEVKNITGRFFMEGTPVFHPFQLKNKEYCQKIWEQSIKYTNLQPNEVKC